MNDPLVLSQSEAELIHCPRCQHLGHGAHPMQVYRLMPPSPTGTGHFGFYVGLCRVSNLFLTRVCQGWIADDIDQYLQLETGGEDNLGLACADEEDDD